MDDLAQIGKSLYAYCTDFVINLANLLGLSYYEINALIFCLLYPLVLIILLVIYIKKKLTLKRILLEKTD